MLSILALAGLASGFVNSLAGGGAVFPTLVPMGLLPIEASASSTVVLFPIQLVSALASRPVLKDALPSWKKEMIILSATGLAGGAVGAPMLLTVSPAAFAHAVPWLLPLGTVIFTCGAAYMAPSNAAPVAVCRCLHFLVSIYGGFFGGGLGVLVLAILRLYGIPDVRVMNGIKVVLNGFIGTAAVFLFIFSGLVR